MNRFLFFILLVCYCSNLSAQQKKALVIAIGNYPVASGFRSINSLNDIPIIEDALVKLGFKLNDIQVLKDEEATKKNIVNALGNSFLNSLQPGDIAYFHFSGHGQQVIDKNGDEVDGLDEALVPYDASIDFVPGKYEGENHLIDDELHVLFSNIRKKLGSTGHLLVTLDACHSGTATRHIGIARGTDILMAPADFNQKKNQDRKDMTQTESSDEDESNMASMIAFFGSMSSQLNYEIHAEDDKNYGALSYAFSKSIHSIPPDASYQQLFDRIRLIIQTNANNQTPEASGILAQPILGGKYLGTLNYHNVKEWQDKNSVVIEGGFLTGMSTGTVVGFYPPETRDIKDIHPIATGIIKESSSNASIVSIADGISKEDAEHAWVIVKEENFGNLSINLKLKGDFNSIDKSLFDELFALPYVKRTDSIPDLLLIDDSNKLLLVSRYDLQIASFAMSKSKTDLFYGLKTALTQYGQAQFLRKLNQENKQIAVEFKLLLRKRDGIPVNDSIAQINTRSTDGKVSFKEGDVVQVKVMNTGSKLAYYTLLDIQPDNKTNVLFPQYYESPSDYFLNPGSSAVLPKEFRLDPPLGQELFKLVASKNPINLRPLDQRRGLGDNNNNDPFAKVIGMSYYKDESQNTRGITSNVPAGQVNIYSVPFTIDKK